MADKYAELRAALDAGPTTGPWRAEMVYDAGYAHINFDSREWNTLRGFCGKANADYIAAANPETIRALLAERDSLGEFASAFLLWAVTGANPDRLEGLINIARGALAQKQENQS